MLSKGLRDEENKKMDRLFHDLTTIDFLPDYWEKQQRAEVDLKLQNALNLSLHEIIDLPSEELISKLKEQHFSYENMEQLSNLLFRISAFEEEDQEIALIKHSIVIYEFVQKQSGTFSFSLDQKIREAREAL